MNPLVLKLIGFVGQRFLHFLLYLLLALLTIGVPYKLFWKGDQNIDKQEVNYFGEQTTPVVRVGCGSWRFNTSVGVDYKHSIKQGVTNAKEKIFKKEK